MENEVTIMNEAIALFDGWKLIKGNPELVCPSCDEGKVPQMCCICDQKNDRFQKAGKIVSRSYFRYHASWDCLMPLVIRIKNDDNLRLKTPCLGVADSIWPYINATKEMNKRLLRADITGTHIGVYQFVQWYNKNKPNGE
jgi:hypothetical protein